ncbi:unnamed protein product [Bemisia tabaci]|uniref:Uncharacterized protein n=1 Tax=Bemisia tabaci TaxID=7038 RepID=A0AAI8UU08_BEMTA|nr:unnamed protein product [Bemisia tabaci]
MSPNHLPDITTLEKNSGGGSLGVFSFSLIQLRAIEIPPAPSSKAENSGCWRRSFDCSGFRGRLQQPELSASKPGTDGMSILPGISSMLYNSSMFMNVGLRTLVTYLDTQPFRQLSVHEYLWGYDEPLVQLASNILPSWINFAKFGLLDRMKGRRKKLRVSMPWWMTSNTLTFQVRYLGQYSTLDESSSVIRVPIRPIADEARPGSMRCIRSKLPPVPWRFGDKRRREYPLKEENRLICRATSERGKDTEVQQGTRCHPSFCRDSEESTLWEENRLICRTTTVAKTLKPSKEREVIRRYPTASNECKLAISGSPQIHRPAFRCSAN